MDDIFMSLVSNKRNNYAIEKSDGTEKKAGQCFIIFFIVGKDTFHFLYNLYYELECFHPE